MTVRDGWVVITPFYGPPIVHWAGCGRLNRKKMHQTVFVVPPDAVLCNTCGGEPYKTDAWGTQVDDEGQRV